ncbi:MAG TPA: DUF1572 family protein [Chitinophagaceae bacterium]|nr:DUF1572 family protein [Chitinophagaceae bacterium]
MSYLQSAKRQFQLYRQLAEKAMAQISDEALFQRSDEDANSIAIIVQHLWGNMLSRWTDFRTTDGEKPWRKRDDEFEALTSNRAALMQQWNEGWDCLMQALDSIDDSNLQEIIYIRNEGHTILEAINRQIAHYSYHVGQIVLLARIYRHQDWQSLSIPRNGSAKYNAGKFSEEKAQRHFTDEWLKDGEQKG